MSTETATTEEVREEMPLKVETPAGDHTDFQISIGSELIDSVLIKLQTFQSRKELESLCIGLTSSDSGAGVSTIASRLAVQAAGNVMGRVLLVDANMNRPVLDQIFGLAEGPGLIDHLCYGVEIDHCIQKVNDTSLDVLPWGSRLGGSSALSPLSLQPFFDDLKSRYQMVIVDLPTIEGTGYGLFFANQTDGVIVVVNGNTTRASHAKQLSLLLSENWVEVIGAILNRQVPVLPNWLRKWF